MALVESATHSSSQEGRKRNPGETPSRGDGNRPADDRRVVPVFFARTAGCEASHFVTARAKFASEVGDVHVDAARVIDVVGGNEGNSHDALPESHLTWLSACRLRAGKGGSFGSRQAVPGSSLRRSSGAWGRAPASAVSLPDPGA